MTCRLDSLRDKEVINVKDGGRIGFVSDAEVDTQEAKLTAVVVYGRLRLFGLLGREADFVIPWKDIVLIGEDTVLVQYEAPPRPNGRAPWAGCWKKSAFKGGISPGFYPFPAKNCLLLPGACAIIFQQNTRRASDWCLGKPQVCPEAAARRR